METGIIIYLILQLIWCGFAMYHMKKEQNLKEPQEQTLNISVVRCSYNDVEKWCDENGYYIGIYWFPNR